MSSITRLNKYIITFCEKNSLTRKMKPRLEAKYKVWEGEGPLKKLLANVLSVLIKTGQSDFITNSVASW